MKNKLRVSRIGEGLLWCPACEDYLPISYFYGIKFTYCKVHQKARRKSEYAALTPEQRLSRLAKRDNPEYKLGARNRNARWRALQDPEVFKQDRRDAVLQHRYQITSEEYNDRLMLQGGGCCICGVVANGKNLSVDHNHKCCSGRKSCGKCIRGIICQRCNAVLGYIESKGLLGPINNYLKV